MQDIRVDVAKKFNDVHVSYVHSPIKIILNSQEFTIVNLPIDLRTLIMQLDERQPIIRVRTYHEDKVKTMQISNADGHVLITALSKRFTASKNHLLASLEVLKILDNDSKIKQLNDNFHQYYKYAIQADSNNVANTTSQAATANKNTLEQPA